MLKSLSIFIFKKNTVLFIFIAILALISSWGFYTKVTSRYYVAHHQFSKEILSGESKPPYQYRVLRPLIGESIKYVVSTSGIPLSERALHKLVYLTMLFIVFWFVYYLFYKYLIKYFDQNKSLLGVLLLQLWVRRVKKLKKHS